MNYTPCAAVSLNPIPKDGFDAVENLVLPAILAVSNDIVVAKSAVGVSCMRLANKRDRKHPEVEWRRGRRWLQGHWQRKWNRVGLQGGDPWELGGVEHGSSVWGGV